MPSNPRSFKKLLLLCVGALIATSSASAASAQEKVKVRGVLLDPWGAVVVGATVRPDIQASDTHCYSDETGSFVFEVPPGTYTVTVEARGFKKHIVRNFEVKNGVIQEMTVRLEVYTGPHLYFYRPEADDRIERVNAPLPEQIGPRRIS